MTISGLLFQTLTDMELGIAQFRFTNVRALRAKKNIIWLLEKKIQVKVAPKKWKLEKNLNRYKSAETYFEREF